MSKLKNKKGKSFDDGKKRGEKIIISPQNVSFFKEIARKECSRKNQNFHAGVSLVYSKINGQEKVVIRDPERFIFE